MPTDVRSSPAPRVVVEPDGEAFSYSCRRCNRCCIGKRIQVNPYEVARLARLRGLTASEVRRRFTLAGEGMVLDQRSDGTCVFLGPDGCTVHDARPLVCRLYPLGRHRMEGGEIFFSRAGLEPAPGGAFGTRGTIADYLDAQGAAPFIAAADAYFDFYCKAVRALDTAAAESEEDEDQAGATFLDIDEMVERHCAAMGTAPPADLESRMRLHLRILLARLDAIRSPAPSASVSSPLSDKSGGDGPRASPAQAAS